MILVSGLTRSGLTVTMQMLYAGGYDCAGEYPAFEPYSIGDIPWDKCSNKAVKLIDPQLQWPPDSNNYRIILLYRNPKQQAKSVAKFLWELAGLTTSRHHLKRMIKSVKNDYSIIYKWAHKYNCLDMSFEEIITAPKQAAQKIENWLECPLLIDRMVSSVINRSPKCHKELLEKYF